MNSKNLSKINEGGRAGIVLSEFGGLLEEEIKLAEAAMHQQFVSDKNNHVALACSTAVYFAFKQFVVKLEKRVLESNRLTKEMLENERK